MKSPILQICAAYLLLFAGGAFAAEFVRSEISTDSLYSQEELRAVDHETALSFLLFAESGWTEALVVEHLKGLAKVYLQCGIRLSTVSLYTPVSLRLPTELAKYEPQGPSSLVALAEKTMELPRPLVFLIGKLSDTEGTPFSRAAFADMRSPVPPALANTLWFPMEVNSPEYKAERARSPYSPLAHELAHVLTLDGDHNNDPVPNLMTIYLRRSNLLTGEHCLQMLKSEFVKPIGRVGS